MVKISEINSFSKQLVKEYKPRKVVLFGSYAAGKARDDSDVDLLVVLPFRGDRLQKTAEMITRLRPRFAVDIILRTPADLERRLRLNDFFLHEAINNGRLLYESSDS